MKKIVLTVFTAAALAACSTPDIPVSDPHAISFGNVGTRAVNSVEDIDEFRVWSSVASLADGPAAPQLTNERVYRNPEGSNTWNYDKTRYWIDNSHFYFLGLYAEDSSGRSDTLAFEQSFHDAGDGTKYILYTLNVETSEEADLDVLAAFNYTDTSDEFFKEAIEKPAVSMMFNHLLTKVNFQVKKNKVTNETDTFLLDKITIKGIKNKGTYQVFPLNSESILAWTGVEDSTIEISKEFNGIEIGYASDEEVKFSDSGLLLIPQPIKAEEVSVDFDFRFRYGANNSGTEKYETKTVTVYLPATADLWQAGRSINYAIQLSTTDYIGFEKPVVTSWGGMQSGGTIIIK